MTTVAAAYPDREFNIVADGRLIATGLPGYPLDPSEWIPAVAEAMAAREVMLDV